MIYFIVILEFSLQYREHLKNYKKNNGLRKYYNHKYAAVCIHNLIMTKSF